jgi:hypothetical protein
LLAGGVGKVKFPTPVAARVLNAVIFPANNVSFPAGMECPVLAAGDVPAGNASLPTTVECSVLTNVTFPVDAGGVPMDIATLPAGIDCLVLTAENLPDGQKTWKIAGFRTFLKDFRSCCVFLYEGVKTSSTHKQPKHKNYEH